MDDGASVDADRKEKVRALATWITSYTHDISSKTAKIYAKALYEAGVPAIEKLVKKLKKNPRFLQSKMDFDADDALELKSALSKVFKVIFSASGAEEGVTAAAEEGGADSLLVPSSTAERYASLVDPSIRSGDRKEKTEAMIDWMKMNTADIKVPNIIVIANQLYDDNCATVNRMAGKLERNCDYLASLGFDADDIIEIVASLKSAGLLRSTFQLSSGTLSAGGGGSSSSSSSGGVTSTASSSVDADSTKLPNSVFATPTASATPDDEAAVDYVGMLDVFSSVQSPFDWGPEIVGLLVGIFSEDTRDWLEGVVINFNPDSKIHDVRFPDDFEIDVDLNTHRIRIQECEVTSSRVPNKLSQRHKRSRYLRG